MGARFRIIPVLDLMAGEVVRAHAGERQSYRPIVSPLAESSHPDAVLAGLLSLAPFTAVYIADLDAIAGAGDNSGMVEKLARRFSGLDFWVDAGFREVHSARRRQHPGTVPVFGSESMGAVSILADAIDAFGAESIILSLDHRNERFIGPSGLDHQPDLWPTRIVVMTLDRVGTRKGPDLMRLRGVMAKADERAVYAAGGVRSPDDIERLAESGVAGALVATTLHDGTLSRDLLRRYV